MNGSDKMAKVYVVSKTGKLVDTIDRNLKKAKAKVGARVIETYPVVTYKKKNYHAMWMPAGKNKKKYFIYPWGQ